MLLRKSLKSSAVVALISGLAGLVMIAQDVVIASHFATGGAADAYQLAISFPLLAVNVFAGGTLLAVMVPWLTQCAVATPSSNVPMMLKRIRRALGCVLLVVCLIWVLVYPHLLSLIAKGFSTETLALSIHLLWLLVPVLFFAGLAGVDAAVLSSHRRFVFISAMPAFMPGAVILSVFMLENLLGIYAAAIGLVFGGALQWLTTQRFASPLLQSSDHSANSVRLSGPIAGDYATAAASAAFLAGIYLTDTFMASTLHAGSAAAYGYAVRPVILVLAFVTAVVGNVVLPYFSHMAASKEWVALRKHAIFWFGLLALGSLPVVALWYCYAAEIVALLYQRGVFSIFDTTAVAAVQQVYLLQIPFYLVAVIGWRLMNSLNRHAALLGITAVCFLANLVADVGLAPHMGLQGIAWGTNLAFVLWAVLITLYLLRLHSNFPSMKDRGSEVPPLIQQP